MFYCNAWKLYVYRGGLQCCQDVTDYFLLSNLLNCFLRRGCMHSCVQHAALSSRCTLKPVHTSNNVEATFDFVEATFDFVERIVRQRCFDIVAGVDGALVFTVTAKFVRVFQR